MFQMMNNCMARLLQTKLLFIQYNLQFQEQKFEACYNRFQTILQCGCSQVECVTPLCPEYELPATCSPHTINATAGEVQGLPDLVLLGKL